MAQQRISFGSLEDWHLYDDAEFHPLVLTAAALGQILRANVAGEFEPDSSVTTLENTNVVTNDDGYAVVNDDADIVRTDWVL